jgi:hypothetical protein
MTELKDKLGRVIEVGDYIVYAHALDRSAALQFGTVLRVKVGDGRINQQRPDGSAITVIGCNEYGWSPEKTGRWVLNRSTGTLMFPNRTIVIDGDQLPDNVRELLDGFKWKGSDK